MIKYNYISRIRISNWNIELTDCLKILFNLLIILFLIKISSEKWGSLDANYPMKLLIITVKCSPVLSNNMFETLVKLIIIIIIGYKSRKTNMSLNLKAIDNILILHILLCNYLYLNFSRDCISYFRVQNECCG